MFSRLTKGRRATGVAALATICALGAGGLALADVASNTIDTTIDPANETMSLTVGGPVGTTNLVVRNINTSNPLEYSDPSSGSYAVDTNGSCNINGAAYVTVELASNDTDVATVPEKLRIDECGVNVPLTVTPVGAGTATITGSVLAAETTASGNFHTSAIAFVVNVAGLPVNSAPTADAGGPYSGAEGSSIPLTGSGADSDGSVASYAWSYTADTADAGAACSFGNAAAAATGFTCTDDGSYTVSLVTTDDDGATSTVATASVTVSNVAPTATKAFDASVTEGSAFSLALTSGTDSGSNDTLTYQFDCGSGYGAASSTASATCPTSDNGSRTARAKVIDDDGGSTEYTDTVTINNAAPGLGALTQTGGTNCAPTYGTSYSDVGTDDTHQADWGDGFAAVSGGSVSKSFSFGSAGNQPISVTLRDDDGGTATASTTHVTYNTPSGILQPINLGTQRSQFKLGSTVPVKITVADCASHSVGTLLPAVSIVRLDADPADPNVVVETPYSATPTNGQNMRYDSIAQQYIYNLGTKNLTQGTWKVSVDDDSFAQPTSAVFNIKK